MSKNTLLFLLVSAIILGGSILRLAYTNIYPFGLDQVEIVENSIKIANGKLMLIGPRSGNFDIFLGPFIYYSGAIFAYFLKNSPYIAVAISVSFYFANIIASAFLFHFLFPKKTLHSQLFYLVFLAFSPYLIYFDRITWNPTLSILATSLIFLPTLSLIVWQEPAKKLHWLSIFCGAFLGYQAHFGLLLLPTLAIITTAIITRDKFLTGKVFLVSSFGFAFAIIPTIIFDYRHNWLNAKNLSRLFDSNTSGENFYFKNLLEMLTISVENLSKIIYVNSDQIILLATGIGIIFISIIWSRKDQELQRIVKACLIWVITICLFFALYKDNKPEYYFLGQMPALVALLSFIILPKLSIKYAWGLAVFWSLLVSILFFKNKPSLHPLNIGNQQEMVTLLKSYLEKYPDGEIIYDMDSVDQEGLRFLVSTQIEKNASPSSNPKIKLRISYPITPLSPLTNRSTDNVLGFWIDQRNDETKNYLTLEKEILATPKNIFLYQSFYMDDEISSSNRWVVYKENKLEAKIWFISSAKLPFGDLRNLKLSLEKQIPEDKNNTWQQLEIGKEKYWVARTQSNSWLIAKLMTKEKKDDDLGVLGKIKFVAE